LPGKSAAAAPGAEVAQYVSAQFTLVDDLDHLDQVQRVGAPEAVILYCARILEVLAPMRSRR